MTLNEKLKKSRLDKGFSQTEVAKQLNISRQSISKWENGHNYPDIDNLILLSKIYDISTDDLLKERELEENEIQKIKELSEESTSTDEGLLLLIITLISSLLTPIGIIISSIIIHRNKKENTYYKMINTLCVFSILINIYFSYIVIGEWFNWNIHNDVQLIE